MNKTILLVYIGWLVVIGLVTFIFFAVDKKKSSNENNPRVPEICLLSLMAFGGSIGGLFGMYGLRHKTNIATKFPFFLTVWLSVIIQAALLIIGLVAVKG